jgi:hypothetical protein
MSELKSMRPEDEISLEDFIRSVKGYAHLLLSHWKIFLFAILLSCAGLWFWSQNKAPTYKATLTLMLSDDSGQSITGISSILGQFGLPVSSGKYNIDKLIEIARSRYILEQVLQSDCTVEGETKSIADHLISLYNIDETWESYSEKSFSGNFKETAGNAEYNFLVKQLHKLVNGPEQGGGILNMDYGRDHYIMTFDFESLSEELSINYLINHFEFLKDFYTNKAVERQRQSYDIIKDKRDSIYVSLNSVENEIAVLQDLNQSSFRNTNSARLSKLSTESLILKTGYAEAEKNLAIAELALQNNTPLIQLIDQPISPLQANALGLYRVIIYGLLLGLFISFVIIGTLYIIRV